MQGANGWISLSIDGIPVIYEMFFQWKMSSWTGLLLLFMMINSLKEAYIMTNGITIIVISFNCAVIIIWTTRYLCIWHVLVLLCSPEEEEVMFK